MRKGWIALVGLLALGSVSASEIAWMDYKTALSKAQKEKKKILVDFYSPT